MSKPTPPTYKTRNWPAYNKALKRRGSLSIWFDPGMIWAAAPTGRRGRQRDYGDAAIQTCLTMSEGVPETIRGIVSARTLFGMALRQTTGFVESLLRLVGLDWAVPFVGQSFHRKACRSSSVQHAQPSSEDLEGRHPFSRLGRSPALAGGQYRDQGRG